LQVLPLADIVVVQVQELERSQSSENLGIGQGLKLIVRQIDFRQLFKCLQVAQILHAQQVALHVQDLQVAALAHDTQHVCLPVMTTVVLILKGEHLNFFQTVTV